MPANCWRRDAAQFASYPLSFGRLVRDMRDWLARAITLEVAHGLVALAYPHRAAFAFVTPKQLPPAPAVVDRGELPAEIDSIADPGVHAEPTVWRHHVHRIAGQKHAAAPILIGHHPAPHPVSHLENSEIDVAPDGAPHLGRGVDRLRIGIGLAVDHQPPALAAVGRRQARPRAFRADDDIAPSLALVVRLPQRRRTEHHVDRAIDHQCHASRCQAPCAPCCQSRRIRPGSARAMSLACPSSRRQASL
jgi:hypothetical protein